jgi:trimeric autotransporter adhesin
MPSGHFCRVFPVQASTFVVYSQVRIRLFRPQAWKLALCFVDIKKATPAARRSEMLCEQVRLSRGKSITAKDPEPFRLLLCFLLLACSTTLLSSCSTASLRSISITPPTGATVLTTQNQTVQFRALGSFQQGTHAATTQDITSTVSWTSSSPSVATIDSSGVATAVGNGTTTITATGTGAFGLLQGTSSVQVSLETYQTGLTSITVVPSTQPITVIGQTANFVAIGNYTGVAPPSQNLTQQVTWVSSAPGVVTITSGEAGGVATAVSPGTATITAVEQSPATGAIVGTATVTVSSSSANGLTAISIIPTSQVVYNTGETSQYIAIGTFSGTTPLSQDITNSPNLKWISSDVGVATISSVGLATETGFGTTAITAEWVQPGAAASTGAATFTSQAGGGPISLPSLSIYKVGNGATTTTATITTSPASSTPSFSCGTGTGCTGYYFSLGTTVTITVSPVPSNFGGFTSNCAPVAGNPVTSCTITLNSSQSVGAIFN